MRRARTTDLLNAAIVSLGTPGGPDEKIIPLSSIETYLNTRSMGSLIPTDGPLPPHLLPVGISRHFDPASLSATFVWKEFTIGDWIRHILDPAVLSASVEFDVTQNPQWAERVLHVLARAWPSCGRAVQEDVTRLLQARSCVPTTAGMRVPQEAYFQSVQLFPDLPHVALPSGQGVKGGLEKLLQALGVRKHVELQMVFNRCVIPPASMICMQ